MTEPPSEKQLIQTTAIAAGIAAVALVLFVLPAEFGVDPIGFGAALGLLDDGPAEADVAAVNTQDEPPQNENPRPPPAQQRRLARAQVGHGSRHDGCVQLDRRPRRPIRPAP